MVVIRESPRARVSPSKPPAQWPPASPFEALMSSPGGRKRWVNIQSSRHERSVSPSDRNRVGDSTLEEEESLQLELQILETKKKLRDLAKKKRDQGQYHGILGDTIKASPSKRRKLLQPEIQIPLSPSRGNQNEPPPAVSPARARLGLGPARAHDVSLKRAAAVTKVNTMSEPRSVSSFSARLASVRTNTLEKAQKSDRLDNIRSKTFAQVQTKQVPQSAYTTSRSLQDIISKPVAPPPKAQSAPLLPTAKIGRTTLKLKSLENKSDPEFYDVFSETHLKGRKMSHTDLAKNLAGCSIYTIPMLLKEVKSPEYEPPDCENDYVVFGILAEKSSPFTTRDSHKVHDSHKSDDDTRMASNKFMILKLCDLKWDIDCFLFGTGFEQFWKLTEGSLIAILNPAIMPPKTNQHNGRFSLKVTSSEDTILEIGTARDLGYCESIKKDGKKCSSWVNKSKTSYCDFHVNLQVDRARKGRMEVNTMWRGKDFLEPPKRNMNVMNTSEYGQVWSTGNTGSSAPARLIDADDTDALHKMTKDEASRKRIAAAQRERDLAAKLGNITAGVAGDYFRTKYGIERDTAPITDQPMFVKPTASELGLLNRKADDQRLSPAKDRRRHFGLGAVTSAGTQAMGWGGARKSGLLQPRESRLGSPERGQTTLDAPSVRGVLRSPTRDRSVSPSKQARFRLDKGIRRPGRESGGHELNTNDYDDDDDLDIV